jgi:hypothetical protein
MPLGEVSDEDSPGPHYNWVWATSEGSLNPYDFDSFRVFVWSPKRHRYETAFIAKNMRGHYPLQASKIPQRDDPGFSLVVEEDDGQRMRRTYAFSGYHIRMIAKELYQPPAPLPTVGEARTFDAEPGPERGRQGWLNTFRSWWPNSK